MNSATRVSPWMAGIAAVALCCGLASAAEVVPRVFAWDSATRGEAPDDLRWPVAVASGEDNVFAVADRRGSRVLVFRHLPGEWKMEQVVELSAAPIGIAFDGGRFVVSLRGDGDLVALEPPGYAQQRVALPDGVFPGALAAARDGSLLVVDLAGDRILRLAAGGETSTVGDVERGVTGLAAAPNGGFYAAHPETGEVRVHAPNGALVGRWKVPGDGPVPAWPVAVAAGTGNEVLVLDRHVGRILVLDSGGRVTGQGARKGWDSGLLLFPSGLATTPDGTVFVSDEGNGRVQVFRRIETTE